MCYSSSSDDYYKGEEWSEDQWNEYDHEEECYTGMIYQPEPDDEPDWYQSEPDDEPLFELYNTEIEEVEDYQEMTQSTADSRNKQLRKLGESTRWVLSRDN